MNSEIDIEQLLRDAQEFYPLTPVEQPPHPNSKGLKRDRTRESEIDGPTGYSPIQSLGHPPTFLLSTDSNSNGGGGGMTHRRRVTTSGIDARAFKVFRQGSSGGLETATTEAGSESCGRMRGSASVDDVRGGVAVVGWDVDAFGASPQAVDDDLASIFGLVGRVGSDVSVSHGRAFETTTGLKSIVAGDSWLGSTIGGREDAISDNGALLEALAVMPPQMRPGQGMDCAQEFRSSETDLQKIVAGDLYSGDYWTDAFSCTAASGSLHQSSVNDATPSGFDYSDFYFRGTSFLLPPQSAEESSAGNGNPINNNNSNNDVNANNISGASVLYDYCDVSKYYQPAQGINPKIFHQRAKSTPVNFPSPPSGTDDSLLPPSFAEVNGDSRKQRTGKIVTPSSSPILIKRKAKAASVTAATAEGKRKPGARRTGFPPSSSVTMSATSSGQRIPVPEAILAATARNRIRSVSKKQQAELSSSLPSMLGTGGGNFMLPPFHSVPQYHCMMIPGSGPSKKVLMEDLIKQTDRMKAQIAASQAEMMRAESESLEMLETLNRMMAKK